MNTDALTSALAALGLSPNAITIYLESMTHGKAPVGRLAAAVRMDRSSANLAAGQLRQFGLLNETSVGERIHIWVKSPDEVLQLLNARRYELEQRAESIEQSLPELMAGYSASEVLPVVQVFNGREGLRQISAHILEHATDDILLFTNQAFERSLFERGEHRDFIAERKERQLPIRALAVDTPEAYDLRRGDSENLRETRIITGDEAPFDCETYIYGNYVAMLSYSGQVFGFVVHSRDFAAAQRWQFYRLWKLYQ